MEDTTEQFALVQPIYNGDKLSPSDEHYPSQDVRDALVLWCRRPRNETVRYRDVMDALRWDAMNKCFCFGWAGMYVGVEMDGHIHT